ncbi:hypothetical protein [Alicyclobacillus dauci]|uniref:Uncharacterized protein n=1 Tax=Alicyclobacillus dauci TaxID=1475485 RepID=A0ABY6Z0R5_9BACL|nr:hypothetical protein [Alicyclobacillus dauci]WAH36406.1 hypothetical protein NZD86_19630 [Alicyclobacillus dauci]
MNRFTRLRWIPILLRAYYEAQMRLDAERGETQSEKILVKDNERSRKVPLRAETGKRPKVKRRTSMEKFKPTSPNTSLPKAPLSGGTNVQLLKELRATNEKLEELASIREQLRELGMSVEDVNRRIDELRVTKEVVESQANAQSVTPGVGQLPPFGV